MNKDQGQLHKLKLKFISLHAPFVLRIKLISRCIHNYNYQLFDECDNDTISLSYHGENIYSDIIESSYFFNLIEPTQTKSNQIKRILNPDSEDKTSYTYYFSNNLENNLDLLENYSNLIFILVSRFCTSHYGRTIWFNDNLFQLILQLFRLPVLPTQ